MFLCTGETEMRCLQLATRAASCGVCAAAAAAAAVSSAHSARARCNVVSGWMLVSR